jgi:hypothetical protein
MIGILKVFLSPSMMRLEIDRSYSSPKHSTPQPPFITGYLNYQLANRKHTQTGQMGQSLQESIAKFQTRKARKAFLWYPLTQYNFRHLKHVKHNLKNSDLPRIL